MIYVVIGIALIVALFLIFRDDHDSSYNKNEKRGHEAEKSRYVKSTRRTVQQPKTNKESILETLVKEVKQQSADPLKEIKGDVMKLVEEAKGSIIQAVQEAGRKDFWSSSTDVDEQYQEEPSEEDWEDEEGVDLSFLDSLDYYEDLEENSETFDISGLRYHCTVYDCGKVVGVVKPDPSNTHDSRAQAVIRSDGKLLGYIPRTQLDWYEDFNGENVECPFIGEIEVDGNGWMQAEIKVIIPSSIEYVKEEIEDEL